MPDDPIGDQRSTRGVSIVLLAGRQRRRFGQFEVPDSGSRSSSRSQGINRTFHSQLRGNQPHADPIASNGILRWKSPLHDHQ
jgi:hypothetical protein